MTTNQHVLSVEDFAKARKVLALRAELDKVIAGYDPIKTRILMALLADGHVLLESVPGLAKTMLINTLQSAISDSDKVRIQMTADLKPTDIVGSQIYNLKEQQFQTVPGPIVGANLVLADEINRATPRAQGALLEAMQERTVTIPNFATGGAERLKLKDPFLVLATQNPIEQEGTYPLPEAQLDRFCFKLLMGYVSRADELKVLKNTAVHGRNAMDLVKPVISTAELVWLRKFSEENVLATDSALEYILDLVRTTRPNDVNFKKYVGAALGDKILVGASPRAEIWILRTAKVRALLRAIDFMAKMKEGEMRPVRLNVTPEDIKAVAADVLRHRILLRPEVQLDGTFTTDRAVNTILEATAIIEPKTAPKA